MTLTLNAQGLSLDWAISIGSSEGDTYRRETGESIVTDQFGNLYISGQFEESADFDPSQGVLNISSNGGSDFFVLKLNSEGGLIWVKSFGGTGHDYGESIQLDEAGNILVVGFYEETVDFDPGVGVFDMTANTTDDFILKLTSDGDFLWAKSIEGPGLGWAFSVTCDTDNNVLIAGRFFETVDLNPNAGTFHATSNGSYDIYLLKLDENGDFLWVKTFGGVYLDWGFCIDTDVSGNVYMCGAFDAIVDFDPGPATYNLTAPGGNDNAFVLKLDSNGDFLWAKNFGSTERDEAHSICVDLPGNVYVTGFFSQTVDFDPSSSVFNLTSNGNWDTFVLKLTTDGNLDWAKSVGNDSFNRGNSIAIGPEGTLFISSYFEGTMDVDPGSGVLNLSSASDNYDILLLSLNNDGGFVSAISFGGATGSSIPGIEDEGRSVVVGANGNVAITGYFYGSGDFDPSSEVSNLSSNGEADIFVAQFCQSAVSEFEIGASYLTAEFMSMASNFDTLYWNFGDGNFSNEVNPIHTYDTAGIYEVCLYASNHCNSDSDCQQLIVDCGDSFFIDLVGDNNICEGDSVLLNAQIGLLDYEWSTGDTTQAIHVYETGEYYVSGISGNCFLQSDTVGVEVTSISLIIDEDVNELTCPESYVAYQWYLNGSPIQGANGQTHIAQSSGNYLVEVTDAQGCVGTSYILEFTLQTGIHEISVQTPYSIYPNPNNGTFQIEMDNSRPFSIEIFSSIGQMVLKDSYEDEAIVKLKLQSGVYNLHLRMEDVCYSSKVIVQQTK